MSLEKAYKVLLDIRTKTNLKLVHAPLMRKTLTLPNGSEVPMVHRYYQVQGILHLCVMDRFLLGDDVGLGKTVEAITALCLQWMSDPDGKAIIFTELSLVAQWASEFHKFCHTDQMTILMCKGDPQKRKKIYEQFKSTKGPTVLIMTYGTARKDVDTLLALEGFTFICDEATAFKNTRSQTYKTVQHLSKRAKRMWALTATMLKNRLPEGYAIYSVLVPGLFPKSLTAFIQDFCIYRMQSIPGSKRQFPIVLGARPDKVSRFRAMVDPYYLGRPASLVAPDLPPLTIQERKVDPTPAQWSKYKETLEGLLVREKTGDENEVTPLTAILYCQQIVDHLSLVDCEGDSAKFQTLFELIESGDLEDEKLIIFSRFEKMITLISEEATRRKIDHVRITGVEKKSEDRLKAAEQFRDPDSGKRLCLITNAAEQGINLQAAKAIIFFDTPWSAGTYLQLLGRMIRIGTSQTHVYAIHLLADRTVDMRVMQVLRAKYKLLEQVLGRRIKGEDDGTEVTENDASDVMAIYQSLLRGLP